MNRLPVIPVIDLRDGGPPRHAELNTDRARSLRDACLAFFPRAVMPLMAHALPLALPARNCADRQHAGIFRRVAP
jgi:hypothetical protein